LKIVDTVVLIGYINPSYPLNERATEYILNVSELEDDLFIPSASLMELDLEFKTHGLSDHQRAEIHSKLARLFPADVILPISPAVLRKAAELSQRAHWRGAYFDSLIVATGLEYHAESAISTDRRFTDLGLKISF